MESTEAVERFSRPLFITFEGGEGCGKSTQSKKLYEFLLSKRIQVIHTREVGGTEEAEKIRNLLVYNQLYPLSQLMLVMAARYEHINKVILPALNSGKWVICDRFIDSTASYQSGDSGLTIEGIFELHAQLMHLSYDNDAENLTNRKIDIRKYDKEGQGVMPDLTFFMDIDPPVARERALIRGDSNNFDRKPLAFHEQIYARFKKIAADNPLRIKTIDCNHATIDEVHRLILGHVFGS